MMKDTGWSGRLRILAVFHHKALTKIDLLYILFSYRNTSKSPSSNHLFGSLKCEENQSFPLLPLTTDLRKCLHN